ncbi:microtubule-destabilizing protein 60-like [Diospyros lotus]|uniref:microtubule-destabilizing protein 60-like n=1 Tax=Diospyros lotus TaxID=55363 RepID=UPI002250A57F|nr:microtubule-destabilizing protein 60-like [Diospyros lotus]
MDLNGKNAGAVTPSKNPHPNRSKASEISKDSENFNPNVASPAGCKSAKSPAIKSATKTTQKSASRNPNPVASPRNKIRERKFVVAKRNSKKEKTGSATVVCKCKEKVGGDLQKCLCVAYESLRASQEEFFKNRNSTDRYDSEHLKNCSGADNRIEEEEEAGKKNSVVQAREIGNGLEREQEKIEGLTIDRIGSHPDETESSDVMGALLVKRRRDKLLEEARERGPETGSGKVMHLVKIFEKLLTIPKSKDSDQEDDKEAEDEKKGMKWALPGLHPKVPETQVSSSSFCPSDFFLTSENLGLDSRVSSSLDSNHGSFTISSRTSGRGHRSRRNSSEPAGTLGGSWWKKKQLKATRQKPFKLQTEKRGRCKEEEFLKKIQEMKMEQEKQRIPIAQGLPWTTDEPECLVKPPVKESTRPIDLVLHSDVRAMDRAEFDQQVAEKMSFIEQYRMERELQQKLAEEEEIRRLRKELVPRAQPMPYFDRPFIPRRSEKHPTVPKEPKFHIPEHKNIKCCMSWNDLYTHQ